MLDIKIDQKGGVMLSGRFDASQVNKAKPVFDDIKESKTIDLTALDYISSAGLGILLTTQKRLKDSGHQLILKNMNKHIREVFKYAGFDRVFQIE